MTEQRDQLETLIEDIDALLKKASPRFGRGAQEDSQQRQILERARQHILDLQQWMTAPGGWGPIDPASGAVDPPEDSNPDLTESAQTVLRALLQEMQYLRSQFIQPLRTEIETLQQERTELLEQVRQLEVERLRLQGQSPEPSSQQEWIQVVAHHLEASLAERLDRAVARRQAETSNRPLLEGTPPQPAEADLSLLDPHQRLAYVRRVQAEADQALLQLDNTLRAVFATLQQNALSYQDSLAQGLAAMHSLGQQGEVTLRALISDLGQQLRQEVAYLEAASTDEQGQLLAAQQTSPSSTERPDDTDTDSISTAATAAAAPDLDWELADEVEFEADEEITLLQLDQEIEQLQLDATADPSLLLEEDTETEAPDVSEPTAAAASDFPVDPLTVLGQLDQALPDPEQRVDVPDRSVDATIAAAAEELFPDAEAEAEALFADLFGPAPASSSQDTATAAEPSIPDNADETTESSPDDSLASSPAADDDLSLETDETGAPSTSIDRLDEILFDEDLLQVPPESSNADHLGTEIDLFGEATAATLEQPRVEVTDTIHSLDQLLPSGSLDRDTSSPSLAESEALAAEPFIPASPDEDLLTTETDTESASSPLSLDPDILAQLTADLSRLEGPSVSAEDGLEFLAGGQALEEDDIPEQPTDREPAPPPPSSAATWASDSSVFETTVDDWKTAVQSTTDTLLDESGLMAEEHEAETPSAQASAPQMSSSTAEAPESAQHLDLPDDDLDPLAAQVSEVPYGSPRAEHVIDAVGTSQSSTPEPNSPAELDPDTLTWETWADAAATPTSIEATEEDLAETLPPEDWLSIDTSPVATSEADRPDETTAAPEIESYTAEWKDPEQIGTEENPESIDSAIPAASEETRQSATTSAPEGEASWSSDTSLAASPLPTTPEAAPAAESMSGAAEIDTHEAPIESSEQLEATLDEQPLVETDAAAPWPSVAGEAREETAAASANARVEEPLPEMTALSGSDAEEGGAEWSEVLATESEDDWVGQDDTDSQDREPAIAGTVLRSPSPATADPSSEHSDSVEEARLDQPGAEDAGVSASTDGEQGATGESRLEPPLATAEPTQMAATPAGMSPDASALPGETSGEWFLGLDIGTTGLSAVLLNRADGQVYPLYWIDSTLADSVAEKIFRLPAVVSIAADSGDTSMPWRVRSHGMAALAVNWAEEAAHPYRLLTAMKPLLQLGIPYQAPDTQHWQPQLPWPEGDPLPLQAVQLGLQSLLQTLTPSQGTALVLGATDLDQQSLHQAISHLQGVIVNYPAAWSDTYSFNLREAILAAGLVSQPDAIYFIEDAIAAILSGLPDPDRLAPPQVQSLKQQNLYGGQWHGGTVVISAGASLSEIAVVNLPHDAEALSREDFVLQRLDYGGNAIDLDIICQLLHPSERRQPTQTSAAPDPDDTGWGWQAALPELAHTPWSSLGLSQLSLPRPGDPDLEMRSQLQQRLESSLLGQTVLEAARHLKLILQHQSQFNLVLGNQCWQVRRKELESQILLPYQRRLNQALNQLLSQTGLSNQAINQVICTGGTASLKFLSDWLRQKLPNATIIQDTYPSNRPPSCSRVAYGLVNLARYPQLLEKTRHQYSDYFLLLELLRTFPDQPMPLAGIVHLLEQRGINIQACQDHLFALLDGHLPPGLLPPPQWSSHQPGRLQALRSVPLFSRGSGQIYVPNSAQCQRLWDYLQHILANKRQPLQEPLVIPLWTMAPVP
ncbi:hypothetical protein [Halomicronema hongdechloris]|uniref:hypothetical protein n=1 Tax=Halomicronema hongdechloris TaxID=1209493 RepID=UPI0010CAE39E|nr:hypothetical protein [Halomicronema hongdechloris]